MRSPILPVLFLVGCSNPSTAPSGGTDAGTGGTGGTSNGGATNAGGSTNGGASGTAGATATGGAGGTAGSGGTVSGGGTDGGSSAGAGGNGDTSPPTLGLSVDNANNCTVDGTNTPMTAGTGHISFMSADVGSAGDVTWVCTLRTGANNTSGSSLSATTCTPSDNQTTCNCTPSHGFGFTAANAGDYTLTISATDGAGNDNTQSVSWFVDDTPPLVTFVSPMGARDVNGYFPGVVPFYPDFGGVIGTFRVDADTAARSGAFPALDCSINGTAVNCASNFDTSSGLYEGQYDIPNTLDNTTSYTTSITATDCVGNAHQYTTDPWRVDSRAPAEWNTPTVSLTDVSGQALPPGEKRINVSLRDDTTNVESFTCVLDGLDTSCALAPPVPTSGTAYSGSFILSNVSAGPHKLVYRVTDVWDHTAYYTFDF